MTTRVWRKDWYLRGVDGDRTLSLPGSRRTSISSDPFPGFRRSRPNSRSVSPGRLYQRQNQTDASPDANSRYLVKDPFTIKTDLRTDSSYSSRGRTLHSDSKPDNATTNALLLKYEIRSYNDPSKNLMNSNDLLKHRNMDRTTRDSVRMDTTSRASKYSPSYTRKYNSIPETTKDTIRVGLGCAFCNQNKQKLESEMKSTEILFRQKGKLEDEIALLKTNLVNGSVKESDPTLEDELEKLKSENTSLQGEIKTLKKEVKRTEKCLDEERTTTKKLGIKLEDANFEKERLHKELISSQFENEKIVDENEDLMVDNEDLIKERDEILQVYDELFRESEKLKHEVEIWKGIFQANKSNLPDMEEEMNEMDRLNEETSSEEDVGFFREHSMIEEDSSLLLPTRACVEIENKDPALIFNISKEEIAKGKFGKLYKAVDRSTGELCTAKYMKVTSKLREDVMGVIEVMEKLNHVRLMSLYNVYDLGSQMVMILEYVGGGTLFERIIQKGSLTEMDCKIYVNEILEGVYHMHSKNICHLELTPENIRCADLDSMHIKITDFGRAKQLVHKKEIKVTAGSPEFVAPEILSFDPVSLASDMWSIGIITYVLLSGVSPFIGDDDSDTLLNVSSGEYEYVEEDFANISGEAKKFIDSLLISAPKERNTVTMCLQHNWIQEDTDTSDRPIDLQNMKEFLKKRKEKPIVSAGRAIRRFSSFAVGPRKNPMLPSTSPSTPFLTIPTPIQKASIKEETEDEDDSPSEFGSTHNLHKATNCCTPSVNITRDPGPDSTSPTPPQFARKVSENTDTADGLRQYLKRMIDEGHLPGIRGGSVGGGTYDSDE